MEFIPLDSDKLSLTCLQALDVVAFLYDDAMDTEEYFDDEESDSESIPKTPKAVIAKYLALSDYAIVQFQKGMKLKYVVANPDDEMRFTEQKELKVAATGLYLCKSDPDALIYFYGPLGSNPKQYDLPL